MLDKYITVPGTNTKIYEGSVVVINRLPNVKWILCSGSYRYKDKVHEGWHFSSIPAGAKIPVFNEDLADLVVVEKVDRHCPCPPHPEPIPPCQIPFTEDDKNQLTGSMITVQNISERDNLKKDWLINGKIVRVNDSDGEGNLEYFSWNKEKLEWEPASLGYRYMTRD